MNKKIKKEVLEVDSTAIDKVSYTPSNNRLVIKFKNKSEYIYHEVPEEFFYKLKFSESFGKAFNSIIKNNYTFEKVQR